MLGIQLLDKINNTFREKCDFVFKSFCSCVLKVSAKWFSINWLHIWLTSKRTSVSGCKTRLLKLSAPLKWISLKVENLILEQIWGDQKGFQPLYMFIFCISLCTLLWTIDMFAHITVHTDILILHYRPLWVNNDMVSNNVVYASFMHFHIISLNWILSCELQNPFLNFMINL